MIDLRTLENTLTREMADSVSGMGGISVTELSTGSEILGLDQSSPRIMASTTKLFTIGAALEHLGADYTLASQPTTEPNEPDTLRALLVKAGHDSHNASAAAVTKLLSARQRAKRPVAEYARRHGADIRIVNGSGLGDRNRCSPAAITNFLASVKQAPYWGDFVQTLPRAGADGTLRLRMRNTLASEMVRAKTGTLNRMADGVRKPLQDSLAGYVFGRSRTVTFSIVREHAESRYAARASIDRMVDALAHYCD